MSRLLASVLLLLAVAPWPPAAVASNCNGTQTGLVPLTDLGAGSYQGHQGGLYPGDPKDFYAVAATRKIVSYFRLNVGDWKNWLATNGPILARLDVDPTWDHATATGGNLDVYSPPGRGGHAIAIVGYTPDRFIVRNSWGRGWGDDGFGYASMGYAMSAFTESYGVRV